MKAATPPLTGSPAVSRGQSGLSLVEVMVALAIGVIVVFGLTELLANSSLTYKREAAFGRLQENGRVAALIAARQMRQSRSSECKSISLHEFSDTLRVKSCALLEDDVGCTGDHVLQMDRAMGYDNSEDLSVADTLDDLPDSIAGNVSDRWVLGDIYVAWGAGADGVAVVGTLGGGSSGPADGESADGTTFDGTGAINVHRRPDGLGEGDVAMISNCRSAHIFTVSESSSSSSIEHGGGLNAEDHLKGSDLYAGSALYNRNPNDPRSLLHRVQYRVFYVCCTKDGSLQKGNRVNGCRPGSSSYDPDQYRPALCVFNINDAHGKSQVLVPDVADMRITYTGDSDRDGKVDFFAEDHKPNVPSASWVSDKDAWAYVRSASVELLVVTESAHTAASFGVVPADWRPDDWPDIGDDTLAADYDQDDERIFQRVRFDVALRPSTPWAIWD